MGYFSDLDNALRADGIVTPSIRQQRMIEGIRRVEAQVKALNELGEHAWYLPSRPLCEQAARAERERTGHFGLGVTRRFDADTIACADCQAVIRNGGSRRHSLLEEIKDEMLKRNPRLADPEWAVEDYRPLRNSR